MALPEPIDQLNHYVITSGCRYHIASKDGEINVRLVDVEGAGTPNLVVRMPAANLVVVKPDKDQ